MNEKRKVHLKYSAYFRLATKKKKKEDANQVKKNEEMYIF